MTNTDRRNAQLDVIDREINEVKFRILENKIRKLENYTMAVRKQDEYLTGSQIITDSNGMLILPEETMTCEKCWGDAYLRSLSNGKDQATNYSEILRERESSGLICTQEEQKGDRFYTPEQITQLEIDSADPERYL